MFNSLTTLIFGLTILLSFPPCAVYAFQITGARSGVNQETGERPFRQEINSFATSGPAFELFILVLGSLQATNQNDSLSYFQLAGIHGFPTIPWDGVVGTNGASYPGYCMHASVVFPTWHRPYLALYEQVIVSHAQTIARLYPTSQQDSYINAAQTLRIPYWDWTIDPDIPEVVTSPSIDVNTPEGPQTIANPLYQYRFQSDASGNGFPSWDPMSNWAYTVRHPDPDTGMSNHSAINTAMQATAPSILGSVYQLFTTVTNYTQFSCTATNNGQDAANNLEYIHNIIHNNVGGDNGHMSYPEVSAFDPVFFLHHANVDRLLALWQAIYPNSYVLPAVNDLGSYYEASGSIDSGNSPLAPFHYDNGTSLFTSDLVRRTRTLGYTYPELVDWNVTVTQLATRVRVLVNKLYNPDVATNSTRSVPHAVSDVVRRRATNQENTLHQFTHFGINNLETQWSIRIRINQLAAMEPFQIHFFLGKPPRDIREWSTATNLIATHAQFVPFNRSVAREPYMAHPQLQGELSITHALATAQQRGTIADISVFSVLPFLKEKLQWRAKLKCEEIVDTNVLYGLRITILSRSVQGREKLSDFPIYGDVEEQWDVTSS